MIDKRHIEKLNKIIKNSIPLKNDVFMIFAKNKGFCQEFLRVILEDDELIVIDNDIQKVIPSAFNKNVVLDMLCRLRGGKIVNVEIQLKYEDFHAKRILSYASKLKVYDLNKGDDYKNSNEIIIIYLTMDDIFKRGSTVYEVNMTILSDQGENIGKWDAGLKVFYVNTKGLTNKTINEYLKLLTDKTTTNDKYRITSEIKKGLFEKGDITMSKEMMEVFDDVREEGMIKGMEKGMEIGIEKGMEKGKIIAFVEMVKKGFINMAQAAKSLGMSEEEFATFVK